MHKWWFDIGDDGDGRAGVPVQVVLAGVGDRVPVQGDAFIAGGGGDIAGRARSRGARLGGDFGGQDAEALGVERGDAVVIACVIGQAAVGVVGGADLNVGIG